MSRFGLFGVLVLLLGGWLGACAAPTAAPPAPPTGTPISVKVLAIEGFLADIAQNVAGERVQVETLMPLGVDLHSYEPTPQDVKRVADSNVLIVNGAGAEVFLDKLLSNAGARATIVEASKGLTSRALKPGEPHDEDNPGDPHFWLDPTKTIVYVQNIRDALIQTDPAGAATYNANADAYIAKLNALDAQIQKAVSAIPPEQRKLVTDHDTMGYYADRYGFEIVGMLIPSFSTADARTAQQLAELVNAIKASGARAIFLEASDNPQMAQQIAQETGVRLVTGLYTHSLSETNGPAPTYLKMLEYDTQLIVDALK